MNYIYPRLPDGKDFGFIRVGGAGLANCMFTVAHAWVLHKKYNYEFIDPTWEKISIGPYIRKEKDKRHYIGVFNKLGVNGIKKVYLLQTLPKVKLKNHLKIENNNNNSKIIFVEGLGGFFSDFIEDHKVVKAYFDKAVTKTKLKQLNRDDLQSAIGVHIRLGDFKSFRRTPLNWYVNVIKTLKNSTNPNQKFFVFSDGTDEELKPVTDLINVKRVFYGNAIADIFALSYCKMIIGSSSTFSAWGAFLTQIPIIKPKSKFADFGKILVEDKYQIELQTEQEIIIPDSLKHYLSLK
jgi:hypothetical protein